MIGSPLRCGMVTGDDFGGEAAIGLRGGGPAWLLSGERVLVLAADLEFLGDILGRLGMESIAISASRIFGLTKRQPMVVS